MFKSRIRLIDIKSIVLFTVAWPLASINKISINDLWMISERRNEARDNGYWMFKYIKENKPKHKVCYVIEQKAKDRKKIEKYGDIIKFGSFKHYVMYLVASKHVSAHVDADSPNSRVSNFLETHGLLRNKRIFLQHGITKDKISFGYYSVSRADLFVCAAKPEYEFCKKEFGYPKGNVKLLGFARFDGLGNSKPKNQILLMPTWRSWLANVREEEFVNSGYYYTYQNLLNNDDLHQLLKENDINLVFYLHSDMQKFNDLFETSCSRIEISSLNDIDIQTLMNESSILITDYSSVAFDMAFMERPIMYYHFDYDEYRKGQHPEGYFSYLDNGFGPICRNEKEFITTLNSILMNNMKMNPKYLSRVKDFFTIRDNRNCERIYNEIKGV